VKISQLGQINDHALNACAERGVILFGQPFCDATLVYITPRFEECAVRHWASLAQHRLKSLGVLAHVWLCHACTSPSCLAFGRYDPGAGCTQAQ
jgi:hypothetical protein